MKFLNDILKKDPDYAGLLGDAEKNRLPVVCTGLSLIHKAAVAADALEQVGRAAVENGNVYQIPGDAEAWDSPVPSGILGAVWLSSVLHPDLCSEADSIAVMNEFYETFYGFTYREN